MAQIHEGDAVDFHAEMARRTSEGGAFGDRHDADMTGGKMPVNEKASYSDTEIGETLEGEEPTEHEKKTLRRIGDKFPKVRSTMAWSIQSEVCGC